jgi:DNA invertase Pin-like site-specific DNA recombinase/predicted nucleotidyltransferase
MTIFGYARVSTDGQTLDSQLEALKAAGCAQIFREKVSGAKTDRTQLARLLAAVSDGDVLIVSRLDRLARSTRDLLNILDTLAQRGASFRSLGDQWADTTTPHGRLMLTVLGGLAEFERELIRSRTGEGRERAKARGQHMGRPPTLTSHQREEAAKSLLTGAATQADLARQFNVSQSTISRLAAKTSPLPLPPSAKIDAGTQRAVTEFMKRLEGKYSALEGILFGSRARGTHGPESDADLAVVLEGARGDRGAAAMDMAGIAFDVMMETGVLIDPLPVWKTELERPEQFSNPALLRNIQRDGLHL